MPRSQAARRHDATVLTGFREYLLLEKRRAERTVREYESDLDLFARFVAPRTPVEQTLVAATVSNVRQFLMDMTRRGLSAAAVRRRIAALGAFFRYAKREGLRQDNPAADVGNIKLPRRLPKAISVKDAERLLATKPAAGTSEFQRLRDGAILELFYASGIRRAELVGIDLADVDFDRRTIRVVGKGNKERYVFFNDAAADALRRYLAVRPPGGDGALFVSRRRSRLSYPQVGNVFRLFVRLSGLEGKITPHTLRHSFATHLHQRGVDIMTIKELLGHDSVATTQIYAKVTLEHMRQAYEEAHPRSRPKRSPR
ncbi:MAG TPA: site-specific tyrosine recombinase/integron integrase [Candidatus Dormibacteraeota bacterium]|nr:site-specific tyrosine recombinase/integron integrase [Candidatus Dormibacteraeota bacterium]